ncbi:hypothetical protein MNBD_NITROSPINAE01-1, partial [hydrothermal vent metagenome]
MTSLQGITQSTRNTLNPAWMLCFFASLGIVAYLFAMPEAWAAGAIIFFFATITISNPVNGVLCLFLLTPFFLGESGWPYYWMTEALVYITLLSAIFHIWLQKERVKFPLKYIFILFIIASAFSLPIDGKEFYYDFWVTPWSDLFAQWQVAHPSPKVHYLRILTNILSGA